MRILFNINHPAHVHLFRNAIRLLDERGHKTHVVARDKDLTLQLLTDYGINYDAVSKVHRGALQLATELLVHTARLTRIARHFDPDVLVSVASPMAAWTATILRVPHFAFDDTEHAHVGRKLYRPFTTRIYTPNAFLDELGPKQVRYNGYHEYAYLHPAYFSPDPTVKSELGLNEDERYSVIRFVSWEAAHDRGQRGFPPDSRRRLVKSLKRYARVFISSESVLPPDLEEYQLPIPIKRIHDALAFAHLYVGESPTMASESAILGTPSVYTNTLLLGYVNEQERDYGLAFWLPEPDAAIDRSVELLASPEVKEVWSQRRSKLLAEKIDVTEFIVSQVVMAT